MILKPSYLHILIWLVQVIFFLPIPTASHGNTIWRMYYEVNYFVGIPWENKNLPLMPQRNPSGIIKNGEARVLIGMPTSSDFWFQIQGIVTRMNLGKIWKLCLINTMRFEPTILETN
jgi:hypothetical protein